MIKKHRASVGDEAEDGQSGINLSEYLDQAYDRFNPDYKIQDDDEDHKI